MSPAVKKTKANAKAAAPAAPSLKLYRRIAVGFVVAVAMMLAAVLYVSTVSATIRVTPMKTTVKTEFIADVAKTPTKDSEVRGSIVTATVKKTEAFVSTNPGKSVDEKAGGTVVVRNVSTRVQPLVATTRFLSVSGILFRLDEGVTVPANGSVEATIHADVAGATGNVGPTTFSIPGLSESLQKSITAENAAAFEGGVRKVSIVTQEDLDRAALELRGTLEEEAKVALKAKAGDGLAGEAYSFAVGELKSDTQAGAEAAGFGLTMVVDATGVFYDRAALLVIAKRKLYEQLLPGTDFVSLNASALQASVDKVAQAASGTASVHVYLDGIVAASAASRSLEPGRFAGMSAEEIAALLAKEKIASGVTVDFTPFWMKRVPRLKDHIYVEIED